MDIHDATEEGDVSAVRRCLDSGVDVNVTDMRGDTTLHTASTHNQAAVVKCLVERRQT